MFRDSKRVKNKKLTDLVESIGMNPKPPKNYEIGEKLRFTKTIERVDAKIDSNAPPSVLIAQQVANLASDIDRLFQAIKTNPMAYIGEEGVVWAAYNQLGSIWHLLNAVKKYEPKEDKTS